MDDKPLTKKEREVADALHEIYIETAVQLLCKHKSLIAMGAVKPKNDKIRFVALMPEEKSSDMKKYLSAYRELLAKSQLEDEGCLLGYDIKYNDPVYKDAICIEIELTNGLRIRVVHPYRFKGILKNKLDMGEIARIDPGEDRIYKYSKKK